MTIETTQKTVSCYTKELGIRGELRITNRTHPFILPGLGESGKHCQKCVVYGIGIGGDKVGTRTLKCKRIECKNCYKNWVLDKVFESTFKIEAYAKVCGDRPSHIVASIDPKICRYWDNLESYDTFHKRVYRHIASMGGNAGLRVLHPYRIKPEIKTRLKAAGCGVPGNGYWKGVRENALNLPRFEEYYSLAVHDHNIVFPSFLAEHKDKNFLVKKIGVLDNIEDTIKLLYYLISHAGVLKESESVDNHPIVFFGDLHRFVPEKFLSEKEILDLKNKIAEKLHCEIDNGELVPISDEEKPSNKDQFIPLSEFILPDKNSDHYDSREGTYYESIINSFPNRDFWWSVIEKYNQKISDPGLPKEEKYLFIEDIQIPEGIEVIEVI
jgi:hypothetical protein